MLKKCCRWWHIWYLLFFCHGAEGQLQWVVKEKVTAYGQNLILFCPVDNCCSEPTGWSVDNKMIIMDGKTFSNDPKVKYHGTYNKDGFGVVIRNLSEADLNVTYHCIYGFDQSTPKYLLHGDVFIENVPDKDKEIDTAAMYKIVVPIVLVVIMVGFIIRKTCVYRSRIKKKRQKQTGTDEEMAVLHNSGLQMENQQGTNEEMEDMYHSDIKMKNQKELCFSIGQKEPITIKLEYGETVRIKINIESNSTESLQLKWQKTHNNSSKTLEIMSLKYSGSSINVNQPQLVIDYVDKEDAGKYKLEIISQTETKSSTDILLQLYGDEAETLSRKENNFFRLYFLCREIAIPAVCIFFDRKVSRNKLRSSLKHMLSLTSQTSRDIWTEKQKEKLFPGGQVVVVSTDFDFTLLYKLIRYLVTAIPAPTNGWGNLPRPVDVKEADDVERIRHLRNIIIHKTKFEICDTDFSTLWTDSSQAIDRLSKGSLTTDVESMRMKSYKKCIRKVVGDGMQEELKKMKEELMNLKQQVADNKQEIQNINIPASIRNKACSLSKKENNFRCLLYLCQKNATQAVRVFFDSKVPEQTLESFLKHHRSSLTDENGYTKEQVAKLFPDGRVVSADFDFVLLYRLIRNLLATIPVLTIPAPTYGWGKQPSTGHLNEADNIEKIRHLRNVLAHSTNIEIDDTDFSIHWTDLSQAIEILSKNSLSIEVESVRTRSFDTCNKNDMEDMRKEQKRILHAGYVELIKKWRREDKLYYDKTGGFTAVLDMVKSKNYMTIIGGPGSGKTATARHIALQLENQGWEVMPVCRLAEIIQYGDRDLKQVFVLDDVLGISAVDMNRYSHIIKHEEIVLKTIDETSKLLFTCRKSMYKEAFKLGLFVTENIIDLQSKDNQLNETEKMAICEYHCKSKGVNPDLYVSLSFTKANYMFPFLCKLFSMEEKYQRLGESFYNKPINYFIIELDRLQHVYTIQYAVLVLCIVNGSKLSVECLPPKYIQMDVFNDCGINLGTPDKVIKDAIYNMSETYFTKLDTEYTFTHDFIFEAIAYHYGCQNQHQILKYLSSSYIANKVTVYEQGSNEDLCIHISEDMYLPLAKRLYTDIQSMKLFDVFMNKSLKHDPFLDVFKGMLKTKPFEEFKLLILRKCQNIHQFVNATFLAREPIQQIDIIKFDRLQVLFGTIHYPVSGSEHTCNVRVISWIINYGHTHLLQEIVNHVKCNNHSTSLVFGSDVMENTRLLLLGCYSDTLDMVELILKYVDPKCINRDFTFISPITRNITPLIAGCTIGNLWIMKALLRNHADVNKCNNWNTSPLNTASNYGHIDVVKCLLSSGSNINLTDINGQSPLFAASMSGHYDVVKCLLNSGADINLCDTNGQSPLLVASSSAHGDIVILLTAHEENVKAQYKTISKGTNDDKFPVDNTTLLSPCGYPEEEIKQRSRKKKKKPLTYQKIQEEKEETILTREQEEKEEIMYMRETTEGNEKTIEGRKEQTKVEKGRNY